MKKLLILSILLMSSLAWAGSTTVVVGQVSSGSGGGGTTCSGNYGQTGNGSGNLKGAGFTWVYRISYGCAASAGDTTFNFRMDLAHDSSHEVVYLIYADNGSGTDPGELLWESDPHYYGDTGGVPRWKTDTVDVALSGTYLWIGFHLESAQTYYFYNATEGATGRQITNNGTFPDVDETWDTANDVQRDEYTPSCYLSY